MEFPGVALVPFIAGAATFPADPPAGNSGFTATLVTFGEDLSAFPGVLAVANLALAFVDAGDASLPDAAAGSACGCESAAGFGERCAASFFAVGCGPDFPAGVDGIIFKILSFSTSTYPKSVLTLNMLSSYATITPYSFLPSLS